MRNRTVGSPSIFLRVSPELREQAGPPGPGHVVDRAARIDEIEEADHQAPRLQAVDGPADPVHPHAPAARQTLGFGRRARSRAARFTSASVGGAIRW